MTSEERFWAKVDKHAPGGCWTWTASTARGYGLWHIGGRTVSAHRVAYERTRGPIPAGLTIDHLCRNTLCVNPDHLEPVTMRENIRRGDGACAVNARKTHCVEGHEFTPENTYRNARGARLCRACWRRDVRRAKAARRRAA